ncbi:MAG: TatD family hydrolase [Eubacteriales bacterium]|nr:TatD family hydrolase [Eubacteriales bacterium]
MIFDTHAHYDDDAFDRDRDELLASLREHGVGTVVNVGASLAGSKRSVELTEKYSFIYGAAGVHPDEVGELDEAGFSWLREQLARPKIVAVGEIGLDYYWDKEHHDLQKEWFIRQFRLAKELGKPVIIHSREAAADTFEIIRKEIGPGMRVVMHCYSYSPEMAREYVKLGLYLGVGGVLTFRNAKKLREAVRETPMDRLLLETDCPYLAPTPFRGKRNDSRNLIYVAREMGELKGIPEEEVIRITEENARRFYGIKEEENA